MLLFVCHANIARSPAAELLCRAQLGADSAWEVRSAGTHARTGDAIDAHIAAALQRRGLTGVHHRSTPVTAAALAEARVILTFEAAQRAWVLRENPGAVRRTFTIRRAARLLGEGDVEQLTHDSGAYGRDDDFADPHGRGPAVAEEAVSDIERMLQVIVPRLEADVKQLDDPRRPPRSVGGLFGHLSHSPS